MPISPLARQILVAGATHLASLSAGSAVVYPSVLLQQLQANDTIIQLNLHNGSWIGSVHGIAGIPSILLPLLMQYRGRKIAFILSCIFIIAGWIFTYFAQNITTLIIGECCHGLGTNSLIAVSFLSVSEMVAPNYRNSCLLLYGTLQAFGISFVALLGSYVHWKTVSLIMCIPVLLALPIACLWPESPSWLACRGKFEECEKVFNILRGTDEASRKELEAMVTSERETLRVKPEGTKFKQFIATIRRRDFYIPALHAFVLINVLYCGGGMAVIIYASDMIIRSSGKPNPKIKFVLDCTMFSGYIVATVLMKFYSSKQVMIFSMCGSAFFMSSAAIITFLQSIEVFPVDSELAVYSILFFFMFFSLGSGCIGFSISSEIMPVKHRGIGGCLYVIFTCVLHSLSLKAYPYLCLYIKIWGVFLIYAIYKIFSLFFIWRYIPETKNRTLHEIEQFYNLGYFEHDVVIEGVSEPFLKTDKN